MIIFQQGHARFSAAEHQAISDRVDPCQHNDCSMLRLLAGTWTTGFWKLSADRRTVSSNIGIILQHSAYAHHNRKLTLNNAKHVQTYRESRFKSQLRQSCVVPEWSDGMFHSNVSSEFPRFEHAPNPRKSTQARSQRGNAHFNHLAMT